MYDTSDARARLAPAAAAKAPAVLDPSCYARFHDGPPQQEAAGLKTWLVRGQNFVVAYSEVAAGAVLERRDQLDEYVLLLPDAAMRVEIRTAAETVAVAGHTLTFIPPGDNTITVRTAGRLVRLITSRAADLAAASVNADAYALPHATVAPLTPWPEPDGGPRLRTYSLDVPPEPGRFGRIWRGTTFMINFLEPYVGPRDPAKLSPHHHDDFEQASLAIQGDFIHHLRWPWLTDSTQWRVDEHAACGSPSVAIIPPPAIHTTQAMGAGDNLLVDIFCPPRLDFSRQAGWVLNAADYPMPG